MSVTIILAKIVLIN